MSPLELVLVSTYAAKMDLNMIDHCVGEVRLIFQAHGSSSSTPQPYLVYAQAFTPTRRSTSLMADTGLLRLQRVAGLNGARRLGVVVSVDRIRCRQLHLGKNGRYASEPRPAFSRGRHIE